MPKVLVIDDDPAIALEVRAACEQLGVEIATAETAASGLAAAAKFRPAAIVLDVLLPDQIGLTTLIELRRRDQDTPVIMITGRGANENAIEAIRLGAYDFLFKPLAAGEVRRALAAAIRRPTPPALPPQPAACARRETNAAATELFVGRSSVMQRLYKQIGCAAGLRTAVLLSGESGSGKELAARAIHQHGARASGPFVVVQCASEKDQGARLFGEGRGSATSGGAFGEAAGGMLFLDEVSALPLSLQGRLATWLETSGPACDVRLAAATQHDLLALAQAGQFRTDLYYSLSGCRIDVPPLRTRLADLPDLAATLLERLSRAASKRTPGLPAEALARLAEHSWPGNVRELTSVLKQALVRSNGPQLCLEGWAPAGPAVSSPAEAAAGTTRWECFVAEVLAKEEGTLYHAATHEMERQVLSLVLRRTDGNQARAAKLLGITRSSLRAKIRELGVVIERNIDVRGKDPAG